MVHSRWIQGLVESEIHAFTMGCDGKDVWKNLGQMQCKKCRFVTSEQGLMQAHSCRKSKVVKSKKACVTYNVSSDSFTCSLCVFQATEHTFVQHLQEHLVLLPFKCDTCNERFTTVDTVRRHIISKHPSAGGNFSLTVSGKTRLILKNAKKRGEEFFDATATPQQQSAKPAAQAHLPQVCAVYLSDTCSSENVKTMSHSSQNYNTQGSSKSPLMKTSSLSNDNISIQHSEDSIIPDQKSYAKTTLVTKTPTSQIVSNVSTQAVSKPVSHTTSKSSMSTSCSVESGNSSQQYSAVTQRQCANIEHGAKASSQAIPKPSPSNWCVSDNNKLSTQQNNKSSATSPRYTLIAPPHTNPITTCPPKPAIPLPTWSTVSITGSQINSVIPTQAISITPPRTIPMPPPLSTACPVESGNSSSQQCSAVRHRLCANFAHSEANLIASPPANSMPQPLVKSKILQPLSEASSMSSSCHLLQHTTSMISHQQTNAGVPRYASQAIPDPSPSTCGSESSYQPHITTMSHHQTNVVASNLAPKPLSHNFPMPVLRNGKNINRLTHPSHFTSANLSHQQRRGFPLQPFFMLPYSNSIYPVNSNNLSHSMQLSHTPLFIHQQFLQPYNTSNAFGRVPMYSPLVPDYSVYDFLSQNPPFQNAFSQIPSATVSSPFIPNQHNSNEKENVGCKQTQTMESSSPIKVSKSMIPSVHHHDAKVNSNYSSSIDGSERNMEEQLLSECSSCFSVVENTCFCRKCHERFTNVELFYQHMHKDIHTLFMNCCSLGYSRNCTFLKIVIEKVNERSLGQLKRIESAADQYAVIKIENDISEHRSGSLKEEGNDESTIKHEANSGGFDRRRHSCEAIVKDESPTAAMVTKRSYSLDAGYSVQQLEPQYPSNFTSSSSQASENEFESAEYDLLNFSHMLNVKMSKEFYKCSFHKCDFSAHQPINLLVHMESEHGNEDEFYCIYCGFMGDKVTDLIHHFALHNSSKSLPYSGSIVINGNISEPITYIHQTISNLVSALERQSKNHKECYFRCDMCESRFSTVTKIKCHLETSSLKTYGCKFCSSVFLDSKSFEVHFLDVHPGRSKFNRVIVNFLCPFRRNYYQSFRKVLKQYVASSSFFDSLPPYSPISEPSNPASPVSASTPPRLESNDPILSPSSFPVSEVSVSATDADCIAESSSSLVSPSGSQPLLFPANHVKSPMSSTSVSDGGTCVILIHPVVLPTAEHVENQVNRSSPEPDFHQENQLKGVGSSSPSHLVPSLDGQARKIPGSMNEGTVTCAISSGAECDTSDSAVSSVNHATVVSVVSNSSVPQCEIDAATAPENIDNSVCEMESARHTDCEDKSPVFSTDIENSEKASHGISSSSKRSLVEKCDCDTNVKKKKENASDVHEHAILYKCNFCEFESGWDPDSMISHMRKSRAHLFYKCYYCGNPYYEQKAMKNHIQFHHGNEPFRYTEFGIAETFSPIVKAKPVSHPIIQKQRKGVQIRVCNPVGSKINGGLEADDLDIVPQEIIPSKFLSQALSTTVRKSVTLKKFTCQSCLLEFTSVYRIKVHHKRVHEGAVMKWIDKITQRPYSSTGKLLSGEDILEAPAERYLCNLCGYRGVTRSSVHKHQDKRHDHESSETRVIKLHGFSAFIKSSPPTSRCNSTSIPSNTSTRNLIRTDRIKYNCHLCPASLSSEFFLRIHLAKHNGFKYTTTLSTQDGLLICAKCNYIAHSNTDLANHVASHVTNRRYTCSICDMESHRKKDVATHIEKRHRDQTGGKVVDRNQRKGKAMKLKVVNLDPVVSLKAISSHQSPSRRL